MRDLNDATDAPEITPEDAFDAAEDDGAEWIVTEMGERVPLAEYNVPAVDNTRIAFIDAAGKRQKMRRTVYHDKGM